MYKNDRYRFSWFHSPKWRNRSWRNNNTKETELKKEKKEEKEEEIKKESCSPPSAPPPGSENLRKITIMTYNVMRDNLHEQTNLCWKARVERIYYLLLDINPDICCLQECRDLEDGTTIEPFLQELAQQNNYEYDIHYDQEGYNEKKLKVVTLWKRDRFISLQRQTFWLSPNYYTAIPAYEWNQKIARPLGVNRLQLIENNHIINIWNTHLGHQEKEKEQSAYLIPKVMSEWENYYSPSEEKKIQSSESSLILGDFNFNNQYGTAEYLCEIVAKSCEQYELQDIGKYAKTILYNLEVNGTYIGTSMDRIRPLPGTIGDRLDYIWGHNIRLTAPTRIWNKAMIEPEPQPYLQVLDIYPSDHFPLVAYLLL